MAYTLMAEASKPVDWVELHRAVLPLRRRVEVFPIPGSGGRPDGLGFSVPQRKVDDVAWEEIVQVTLVLRDRFGMTMYELRSGSAVTADTMETIKKAFLDTAVDCA